MKYKQCKNWHAIFQKGKKNISWLLIANETVGKSKGIALGHPAKNATHACHGRLVQIWNTMNVMNVAVFRNVSSMSSVIVAEINEEASGWAFDWHKAFKVGHTMRVAFSPNSHHRICHVNLIDEMRQSFCTRLK